MLNIIFFILFLVILSLIFALYLVIRRYTLLKNDVLSITKAVQKVRYGDINVRVQNLNNKKLEAVTNRLIETMYDREMMIKEYQTTLSEKNLTLEDMIKQEKQLQAFKEEFAATLTHDMKVPVIAELNSINYLLEGRFGNLNDRQIEVLSLMRASNQELSDLIENILETYRLDQKGLKLNLASHNFNEFLIPIIKEMYPIIFSTGHNIVYNVDSTSGKTFVFDEFQIKRVIKNLIQNAVSFSPNHSEINIMTDCDKNNINFKISNIGNNISKEDLDMIFNKYYSAGSKFKKAGTGLGLYLSQQIALAHNGSLNVNSEKDGITSFILTLPFN